MNIIIFTILGFCTSLLFPPYFIYPLGFVIFPYLCIFIENNKSKLNKKSLFLYSFVFGIGFFTSLLFWITNPFLIFEETSNYFFLSFVLVILITIIFSLIFTLITTYIKYLPIIITIPLIFICTEIVVSNFIYGFPWITFTLITSNNLLFLLIIKHFGTLVTSFLTLFLFCIPYLMFYKIKNKIKIYFMVLFITPLIVVFLIQKILDQNIQNDIKETDIEIFQINQKAILNYEEQEKEFQKITKLISKSNSEILIFAENNLPFKFNDKVKIIQKLLKTNQTVIIGATTVRDNNFYNSLININKLDIKYYDKKILVPFGEFLPFRNFLKFFEPISGSNDYSEGAQIRKIQINKNFNYIPVICYEIIFYWKLIHDYNSNIDLIINITNDLWFGKYLGPYQHLYLSKLRASEFNKTLVRVSNNGISAIINQNGAINHKTELFKEINLKKSIKIKNHYNFYKFHIFLKYYFIIVFVILIIFNLKLLYGDRKT